MKIGIYAIKDMKTCFINPHWDYNDQSAIRNFRQAVNMKDTQMNFNPADFSLYRIGTFDNECGLIFDIDSVCLVRGEDCVEV